MRISLLVAISYFLIVGLAAWFVLEVFVEEVKPGVRKTMEDVLVDNANLIAELVTPAMDGVAADRDQAGRQVSAALAGYGQRDVDARIWDHHKRNLDLSITVTDADGRVLFATDPAAIGADHSRWNDIYLTLAGRYGARSTRTEPDDEDSSVMHVAAPVLADGTLIGVVSLAKPTRSVGPIVAASKNKIRTRGLLLLALAALIGAGFTWKLSDSIGRLGRYARSVRAGARTLPHRSRVRELADLSDALGEMREQLEGKKTVERYLHSLTHELKSPLAAIRGAAELLEETGMPATERQRFLENIREQSERLSRVAERLLELARVEQLQVLTRRESVDLTKLLNKSIDALVPLAMHKDVCIELAVSRPCSVQGDPFLLGQAVNNLLDNAVGFSPDGGTVQVRLTKDANGVAIGILDQGPGIPDYAQQKVFERFYSLPRPAGGRKGTGLGLSFVREVAALHQGSVLLQNRDPHGLYARLMLPTAEH